MFIVVTGGSGSGKSEYAENQMVALAGQRSGEMPLQLYYLATMYPFDEESHKRIARHRAMRREKHFETVEQYTGIKDLRLPPNAAVLLECMSNLTANEMYQPQGAGTRTVEEILDGIRSLKEQCVHLVVVTNEIFSDGIEYDPETRRYQQYLGAINQAMAGEADKVVEVVYGIPLILKDEGGKTDEDAVEQL